MTSRRKANTLGALAALLLLTPPFIPEALAFPYHRTIAGASVWSETPLPSPATERVLDRADALVRASPLAGPPTGRRVFLTEGGWRWRWLSLTSSGAFGLTRPFSEAVVVNRSDVAVDRVVNGATVGGTRTLSGVIAHERTHGLVRARFGVVAEARLPLWAREGYPDYVARESSLSDAQAAMVRRAGASPPALAYYDARRRVAQTLAANGGSVDRLFADARR